MIPTQSDIDHALYTRVHRFSSFTGEVVFPADPGGLEGCLRAYTGIVGWMGVVFSEEETDHLREALRGQIDAAYAVSPAHYIAITSNAAAPNLSVEYSVAPRDHGIARGEVIMPAVPGLLEEYVLRCLGMFSGMGVVFSEEQVAHLREALRVQLDTAHTLSSRSYIGVVYAVDAGSGPTVDYEVVCRSHTIESAYDEWVATRTPPLFGTEPDARVWDLAAELEDPADYPILDIGAGTGRNSLALARRGHPVDAVEMTQSFAAILHEEAEKQGLGDLRVIPTEVSAAEEYMHEQYAMIFLSEVISDFRTVEQVRGIFELASRRLAPGGALVFNAFMPKDGHAVSDAARQFGQFAYTSIFTRDELDAAASGLGLDPVSDESVFDYEQAHLPAESWPPTTWYPNWTSGLDVFETGDRESCPIDMRWLIYRRRG